MSTALEGFDEPEGFGRVEIVEGTVSCLAAVPYFFEECDSSEECGDSKVCDGGKDDVWRL